jgi:hypothetical protein
MVKDKKIVIVPKNTCINMCSQKKVIEEKCGECFEEIQRSADLILKSIHDKFEKQHARISDEWAMFLQDSELKLIASITNSKEKTDQLSSNSKWVLSIVLGVTFCIGLGFGMLWDSVAEMKSMKADIDKVLTKKEAQAIHEIRDAYYKDIFVHNPDHKIDSTNYNYLIKSIFGGTLRGGGE